MRRALIIPLLASVTACAPRLTTAVASPSPVADVILAGGPEGESAVPSERSPVRSAERNPALASVAAVSPALSARMTAAFDRLRAKSLAIPVAGVSASKIEDSFTAARDGERQHNAVDILAPKNTPIVARISTALC